VQNNGKMVTSWLTISFNSESKYKINMEKKRRLTSCMCVDPSYKIDLTPFACTGVLKGMYLGWTR